MSALGIEHALGHLGAPHLGTLAGWTLGSCVARFLTGTTAAVARCDGEWSVPRITASLCLIGISPQLATAPLLAAIGAVAAPVLALAVAERGGSTKEPGRRNVGPPLNVVLTSG